MTIAFIFGQYNAQLNNLIETANNVAESNIDNEQRQWRIPVDWTTPPWEIFTLGAAPFDRSDMDAFYQTIFFDTEGKVADCMVTKMQSDHLAVQERAWRLRHAGSIRCQMHAASRRKGQANDAGSFARITNHMMDILASGDSGG